MLVTLNVKNFAIIDNIQIDFNDGFTVLTGETGAGKSLIIDAISLLFGERAAIDLVRHGENKATIEGLFSNYSKKIIDLLDEFNIEYDENDFLIIKRELYQNGKSLCKINNQTVSLNQLKQISEFIGDIHSQMETFGLINPKNYLSFIKDEEIDNKLIEYNTQLKQYRKFLSQLQELENDIKENSMKEDYLKYQLNELEKANLDLEEENNLQKEIKVLSNFEKVKSYISNIKEIYNESDLLDKIYESISTLDKLSNYDETFKSMKDIVEEAYYNLEAISSDKIFHSSSFDFNEDRFNEINDRLGLYSDLKRKYKKSVEELIKYRDDIRKDLDNIGNYDALKEELNKNVNESFNKTLSIAKDIRNKRIILSSNLINQIESHLLDLQLNNSKFEIVFNEIDENNIVFSKDGIDVIDFYVSFNKGEPLKPLSKTASGGELSRFMLALKTVLGDKLPTQTKIFDEIDSGVSGGIAYSIGKKLENISLNSQVLCITHLPQVASIAKNHYKISKCIVDNRTFTKIESLNFDNRVHEIASMLSNGNVSESSLKYAEELLKNK